MRGARLRHTCGSRPIGRGSEADRRAAKCKDRKWAGGWVCGLQRTLKAFQWRSDQKSARRWCFWSRSRRGVHCSDPDARWATGGTPCAGAPSEASKPMKVQQRVQKGKAPGLTFRSLWSFQPLAPQPSRPQRCCKTLPTPRLALSPSPQPYTLPLPPCWKDGNTHTPERWRDVLGP